MNRFGPCLCGATDCPSCGPAQGYEVVRVWRNGRYTYVNPDPEPDEDGMAALESEGFDLDCDEDDERGVEA